MPLTIFLWKIRNRSTVGRRATITPAITGPKIADSLSFNMVIPTCMVLSSFLFVTSMGHTYWFQTFTKEDRNTVVTTGRLVGIRILKKNRKFPQPSIAAASFKLLENPRKCCRSIKILAADTR